MTNAGEKHKPHAFWVETPEKQKSEDFQQGQDFIQTLNSKIVSEYFSK